MSLYGAVRAITRGWAAPVEREESVELLPIKDGAWAAWAKANLVGDQDHSLTEYPCRMPDGRMGLVAAIFDQGEWTLVCRME